MKYISYTLKLAFFFFLVLSCSSPVKEEIKTVSYLELASKYENIEYQTTKAQELFSRLNESKMKSSQEFEITQGLVDQYAIELGYNAGDFTVENVNTVIQSHSELLNSNFQEIINNVDLSDYAKEKIIEISEGKILNNLDDVPEFVELSVKEKEIIVLGNEYLKDISANGNMARGTWGFFESGLTGAVVGGIICGGPVGMIAGWFIGGWIHGAAKQD